MKFLKIALVILAAALFIVVFYYGAERHSREVNTDYDKFDQGAYMYYAQNLHDTHYHFTGDRNRHPLYPIIMSVFYRTGMSLDDYFVLGKRINIIIALLILAALAWIFFRFFPRHTAINLFFITAFTVFIFKAPYFQCELLFFFLSFLTFLLILKMFTAPTWYYAILTGIFTGLTFLTKASVMPALGLLAVWFTCKQVWLFVAGLRAKTSRSVNLKQLLFPFITLALVIVTFIIVVYPYIKNNKKIFGEYFYNVNSTFYMWYDSREQIKSGTRAHGDRTGWPQMPPEQIPSMKKYFQEHTLAQVFNRVWTGGITSIKASKQAYGYFWFIFLYTLYFILILFMNRKKTWLLLKEHIFLFLFLFCYFGVFFGLNAWWNYLGPSVRHILTLFLPFLFVVNLIIRQLPEKKPTIAGRTLRVDVIFNVFISVVLLYNVYIIMTTRLYAMTGGM
ncbi:MAG TPA: hypothetical protein PLP19_15580 [bacterium]|nr:hypothetical protein [bacterium]HPN44912.1 hypothetical protein [bacterium]